MRAALWMAASIASFVGMAVAVRQLSARLPTAEILFFRSLVSLLLLLPLVLRQGAGSVRSRAPGRQVVRNVVHFVGQYAWVWAVAYVPLAAVTAIEFTTPLWAVLIAAIWLRERVEPHRWVALGAGLAGVLLIVRPGMGGVGPGAAVLLVSAVSFAASTLIVKALTRVDSPVTVVVHMAILQLPMGLAPSLLVWVPPERVDLPALVALGLTALTAHYTMTRALALADASFVMPIDFLRLPCVAVVALALYGEPIDAWTLVGAAVISAGNTWGIRHEARRTGARAGIS